jgi:Mg-chelatase subunit ChlD
MSAIISALDNHTSKQFGENGHVEYGWSNSLREQILQFSFQVIRTKEDGVNKLKAILRNLLISLKNQVTNSLVYNNSEREVAKGLLSVLYRLIGQTRDIIDGKGEYTLTYMMIHTWYEFYPELAFFALKCLVDLGDKTVHQYGSWKDIKYFCEYCRSHGADVTHPLIQYAIRLTNEQLKQDYANLESNATGISLLARWTPREKSSFGWLYQSFATDYFSQYMDTANTHTRHIKATLKCKTEYRKVLSSLNKQLDTLQIKQCGKKWSKIDFNRVTSISNTKQKKAFLNIKKNGEIRHSDDEDRIVCAENFRARIKKAVDGEVEMKGKRVGMADFTKQALDLIIHPNDDEINLLNSQWRDNSSQNGALGNFIAMVDVSGSMAGDPMNVAISLGIRISEKSKLGKRVMTFSSTPTWVNLEGYNDFVSQVEFLKLAPWGMNTNFYAALDMILDAIIVNKLSPEDVQDMVLVVLSDMQMDAGDSCNKEVLYEKMKDKYETAGIRVHGKPYKPPHILFWNLRSTSGFPSLSSQPNCSMMSGFSPALLNLFCDQGMDALQSCTPWSMLEKSLENQRYKIMGEKISQVIQV